MITFIPIFVWVPPKPNPGEVLGYKLYIWEVVPGSMAKWRGEAEKEAKPIKEESWKKVLAATDNCIPIGPRRGEAISFFECWSQPTKVIGAINE